MELVLRKRSSGDLVRLSGPCVLCRNAKKLAFVAPYPAQWVLYTLAAPQSSLVRYNRESAPRRCPLEVGDLLDLNGLELVVDSLQVDTSTSVVKTASPPCEIEIPGSKRIRIVADHLIGIDRSGGFRLATALDHDGLTALLACAAGRWHLHDLNGNALIRNGLTGGPSLVLANGDRVRMQGQDIIFRSGAAATGLIPPRVVVDPTPLPAPRRETPSSVPSPSQEIDPVYRKARDLCQRLLPVLHDRSVAFRTEGASNRGLRAWLRLLRRPRGPIETLERFEFLLSGSPTNRVWLIELCRFLFQQSYTALSLRVARSLCRLYPLDGALMEILAKLYYQRGCSLQLSAPDRLNAFAAADKCASVAGRLLPDTPLLAELQQAARAQQQLLRGKLAAMAACPSPWEKKVNATGGRG